MGGTSGHDAEKVASEGCGEQVCGCYQLLATTGPLLLHLQLSCCQVAEEEEEEEAALPPETHLDFLPGAAAVAAAQVARAAHLQPEGLPANHRQEQNEGMRSGIRVSEGFVYQDPCREGGSGFSDTLQPPVQTLSGKSVSDKIRIKK